MGTNCTLCELPTPAEPYRSDDTDGSYCCRGCLEVARVLDASTIEDADPTEIRDQLSPDDSDATEAAENIYLSVDGMHCATCEAFLESTAVSHDGIETAQASYATDTLKIGYDPETVTDDAIPETVSGYGYTARPRSIHSDDPVPGDVAVVKFLIGGGLFGMMTMVWYVLFLYPTYFGYEPLVDLTGFDGLYLFTQIWLLTSLVLFYTGYPILRGAYVSLKAGHANMDLLVSIAAVGSYGYSTLAMALGRTDLYFDVTVAIILVVTLGNYYESAIKQRASDLLTDLTAIQVADARRPDGETIPIEAVESGDELLVRPGDRIPVDGTVKTGVAAVDEALVTGESIPRTKRPGDAVRGGTVVTDQPLTMTVAADASSALDRIVELLWEIQSSSPGVQRFADKLATIFVPLVITIAVVTVVAMVAFGASITTSLLVGLTVIIVSCPCALGLATPLAVARGIKTAATNGIVIASETVFEDSTDVDVIALDKTGTLTSGEMQVTETIADEPETVLSLAAAVERASAHPIADAIVAAAAAETRSETQTATDGGKIVSHPQSGSAADQGVSNIQTFDRGVRGSVDGHDLLVGHPAAFSTDWYDPNGYRAEAKAITEAGSVAVVVGWAHEIQGVIAVGDEPKPEWESVIEALAEQDREIVLLTGDDAAATTRFESHPLVDHVFSEVPPEAKAATITRLKSRGRVAMVGDGSNDAPALAAADLGIALATGTKLATDAGDAIVIDGNLESVPRLFTIATNTRKRIRQNLGWAFFYNAVAIPLAVFGLLNPLLAALAMGASSLLVVLNSTLRSLA